MARETGEVSDDLIKRYVRLAKGGVGLIIPDAVINTRPEYIMTV
jgi:2,4-dienoyl-CoA reductase-like NADH-dependent reductase (Old Yellow Enzyme family)